MTTLIGIAGDWHGDQNWALARLQDFRASDVKLILHLGDFGIWQDVDGDSYLSTMNTALADNGQHILVTLGNHENYTMVGALVTITGGQFAGWQFNPELPRILYATRGQRWEWEGVSFVSLGGANSIDRFTRQEGINWWSEEQISYGDVMRTADGGYADVFLSHDCPSGVPLFDEGHDTQVVGAKWSEAALTYAAHSRESLRAAVDDVKPGVLFHGHYHHYLDLHTELTDWNGEDYTLHSVSMGMNDQPNNIGVLELPSKEFTLI